MAEIARQSPRTFASPAEALGDLFGLARRARPLAAVYLRGRLDPKLRERVMVAVSRVNSCSGCTFVHERWAARAGVSSHDLEAIGRGGAEALDDRSRVAVGYAAALAETRFRGPIPADVGAYAADLLSPGELEAVDAVARAVALASLSVNTAKALPGRLRYRDEHRRRLGAMGGD